MSTAEKIYVGDTGTAIILDCGTDISTASARSIEAKKPDNTLVSWSAVASGTTAVKFVTLAGSLDQAGTWRLQAKVTTPDGTWRGETVPLEVYAVFN